MTDTAELSDAIPRRLLKRRLTTAEAAEYLAEAHDLKLSASTLEKLRSRGGGPSFLKFRGISVVYQREALDEWVALQLGEPVASTSELTN